MSTPKIPAEYAPLKRTAWVPVVEDGDGGPKGSKLGGAAWIPEGTEHPVCPNCGRPMQLFVQLDVASLPEPERFGGPGLLQLFYCTTFDPPCDVDCEAFFPYARSVVARRVDPSAPGAPSTATVEEPLAPKRIVGWTPHDDYPNWEESEEAGVSLDDGVMDELSETWPLRGEKLAGWPLWVQGIEYPECQECGATMGLVFQIDSDCLLDWMWGDTGTAHLTQCPAHPDRLAFGWACG